MSPYVCKNRLGGVQLTVLAEIFELRNLVEHIDGEAVMMLAWVVGTILGPTFPHKCKHPLCFVALQPLAPHVLGLGDF